MKNKYILLIGICLAIFSCQTTKQISIKKDIPAITENRLFKNINSNQLDYNTLFAKRVDISLSNKKGIDNFKASLKIQRDSFIQISITASLGIELARILLTSDSIKFVDLYHKEYLLTDYNYFQDKYDVYITYNLLQSLLTNTFFNLDIYGGEKNKKYKLDRVSKGYELSTVEERALSRKIKKLYKKKRKNKDFILILHRILIDPYYFRPLTISMEDVEEHSGVNVNYDKFNDFSGTIFPKEMVFNFISEQNKTSVELKFQKIEFNVPVESNLKISSKYKKIE